MLKYQSILYKSDKLSNKVISIICQIMKTNQTREGKEVVSREQTGVGGAGWGQGLLSILSVSTLFDLLLYT